MCYWSYCVTMNYPSVYTLFPDDCPAGVKMGSHVFIKYTISMIQAFIRKGHSTDRIRLIIAKSDLFFSCRNTYISVKYSYSSPQSASAGTIISSCASSQPGQQMSTLVLSSTKIFHFKYHLSWSHVLHLFLYRVDVAFPLKERVFF